MITYEGKPVWYVGRRGLHLPLTHGKEPNGTYRARVYEERLQLQRRRGIIVVNRAPKYEIKEWLIQTLGPYSKSPNQPWWIGGLTECTTILPKFEPSEESGKWRQTNIQDALWYRNYFFRKEEDWFMFCLRWF